MGLDKSIYWDDDELSYIGRVKINNQTVEICFDEIDSDDYTVWFNISLTVYNKKKDVVKLHDKEIISGLYPFETVVAGIKLFNELETEVINSFNYLNIIIYCQWYDNRRRDAYWKILSKKGYYWGRIDNQKVIMKRINKYESRD